MLEGVQPIWLSWVMTILLLIMMIMFAISMFVVLFLEIRLRILLIKKTKERGKDDE